MSERVPESAAQLHEELRLCKLELSKVRVEYETAAERNASLRRETVKAQREASRIAQAVADELFDRTRRQVASHWWPGRRNRVSRAEWDQVAMIRGSKFFNAAWYLRQNPDAIRSGLDPALHFLRIGHRAGCDPGPRFDLEAYTRRHPELRKTRENPLLHYLRGNGSLVAPQRRTAGR